MTIRNLVFLLALLPALARADVGDPQIRTDHLWYPGELACSTFERLFATQQEVYRRVTGRSCDTDEDKVLAAWLWRNTHYWHGEEGAADLWGEGLGQGSDTRMREYWTGLFAHGFGLCGTTHSQWVAEIQTLLGPGRARSVGTAGHNSFESFLTGGPYGKGRWAMVDHDLSTVIFAPDGSRLLGIGEIANDWQRLTRRDFLPERNRGWLSCGLFPGDASSFAKYAVAEYLSGYSGPPPQLHLRRGETLRRYLNPGLEDGRTFVFWGRNYNTAGIPGPERSRTWVNQPDQMFGSDNGTPHIDGQARYANAVFTYRPDFSGDDYREAIVDESDRHVTFEFRSPYVIAAAPRNDEPWGIYDAGCREGLVLQAAAATNVTVTVSADRGMTWSEPRRLSGRLDLTDHVKGSQQYWLKINGSVEELRPSGLVIRTVTQANVAVLPRLTDDGSRVEFAAGRRSVVSAGPNLNQARPHRVAGDFGTPTVTLKLATPRGEPIRQIHAAAHVRSSSPPDPEIRYQIDYSFDGGQSWQPVVRDWQIVRRGDEPADFWSQSLCWGAAEVAGDETETLVRFRNDGGKQFARAELHLVYETAPIDPLRITFAWSDADGEQRWSTTVSDAAATFTVPTKSDTQTQWVEFAPRANAN